MQIQLQQIHTDFHGERCFVHARGAMRSDGFGIITTQPLRLSGSDIFYGMHMLKTTDGGQNWSAIEPCCHLKRQPCPGKPGWEQAFCDATPFYHKKTRKFLLTGHNALYCHDKLAPDPRPRRTVWTVYDEEMGDFEPFRILDMPEDEAETFFENGAGCSQIMEMENGDLLIPIYYSDRENARDPWHGCTRVMVLRCAFDGQNLRMLEMGNSISVDVPRGLGEPSIIRHAGGYLLALRNDESGYVAASMDGLHWEEPVPLCFDDGHNAGNYNTQQHWIRAGGRIWMVYTRRAGNNDHVFRHRAPLFVAEFDPRTMKLIRSTEEIAVPERGARLGNFGCMPIGEDESWVVASEWMQTLDPNPTDWRRCMQYGSDNSIFISKIVFS